MTEIFRGEVEGFEKLLQVISKPYLSPFYGLLSKSA
jgi:hypothetical protein